VKLDIAVDQMRQPATLISVTPDRRLPGFAPTTSFEAEQFKRLRARIEELALRQGIRIIAITSPGPHEGKTLTAVNLAAAMAQPKSARVLLIDADFRRPNVAKTLGAAAGEPGLVALLEAGGQEPTRYIRRVTGSRLDVLACETPVSDPYEILTSSAFRTVLDWARQRYDVVILDTAPVVPVPDSGLIGRLVDGYIVVVSANVTPRKLLGEALNLLEASTVLGLVFNRDAQPLFGYSKAYHAYFEPAS
jgi:succinoglycan biosynthesis transport protein ExoP